MNQECAGRVFDGVGCSDVGLAAVEDQRVAAEIEQQRSAAVLAGHAQATAADEGGAAAGIHHVGQPSDQAKHA